MEKRTFVIDCFSFMLENLNPFSLERNFSLIKDRDCINMLWEKYIPQELYRDICLKEHFEILSQLTILFQQANLIIKEFIIKTENGLLLCYSKIYQYVLATIFPRF